MRGDAARAGSASSCKRCRRKTYVLHTRSLTSRDTSCAARTRASPCCAKKKKRSRLGQCSPRVHASQCRAVHETVQQRRQHASAVNVKRPSQLKDERQRLLPSCTAPPSTTSAPPRVRVPTALSKCLVAPLALRNVLALPDCTAASQRRRVAAVVAAVVLRDQNPARQQRSPAGLVESASQSSTRFMSCASVLAECCCSELVPKKKLWAKSACGHCILCPLQLCNVARDFTLFPHFISLKIIQPSCTNS